MPGRWRGRGGGFDARQVVRPGFYAGQECGALGIEALGEPSNEVGRASTHWGARTHWASQYSLGEPSKGPLGEPALRVVGQATQPLSQWPPRLLQSCACLALTVVRVT